MQYLPGEHKDQHISCKGIKVYIVWSVPLNLRLQMMPFAKWMINTIGNLYLPNTNLVKLETKFECKLTRNEKFDNNYCSFHFVKLNWFIYLFKLKKTYPFSNGHVFVIMYLIYSSTLLYFKTDVSNFFYCFYTDLSKRLRKGNIAFSHNND